MKEEMMGLTPQGGSELEGVELEVIVTDGGCENSPLSPVVSGGTEDHAQPAVILVFDENFTDEKYSKISQTLLKCDVSFFKESSSDNTFICLHLTEEQSKLLAQRFSYHVPFTHRDSGKNPNSLLTKLKSILRFGSLSYKCFTQINYTVMYNVKLKNKGSLHPELSVLNTVRVQAELIYHALKSGGILDSKDFEIASHFIPHTPEATELEQKLSWFPLFFPLKEFRDYFGEELAFVYAWSNFWWIFGLVPLALFSVITVIYGLATQLDTSHPFGEQSHFWRIFTEVVVNPSVNYYIGFLVVWISVFQYQWNTAASILSLQWGVANFSREETIDKRAVSRKRLMKLPNLVISIGGFLMAALITVILFLLIEVLIRDQLNDCDFGDLESRAAKKKFFNKEFIVSLICSLIYSLLNHAAGSFLIPWISNFLTTLENHKFHSFFSHSVIFKHTGYYLMSSYCYLIYLVFRLSSVLEDRFQINVDAGEECHEGICMVTITEQIVCQVLILRLTNVLVFFLKNLITYVRERRKTGHVYNIESHDLQYIVRNYKSLSFLSSTDTATWMTERVLMYGYVLLFSYHLPLVALLALLIEPLVTYYEIKMLLRCQRAQPRRVAGIKQWEGIIYLINIMCVVMNSFSINLRTYDTDNWSVFEGIGTHVFMPAFILLTGLIHIQNELSGDKVQHHVHEQYIDTVMLLSDTPVIEMDSSV